MSAASSTPHRRPLPAAAVRRRLDEITGLTGAQSRQAYAIVDMIGSDGTASTTSVLALFEGKDPRGALHQFKNSFNKVFGGELEFVFDGRKRGDVWFTGTDPLAQELFERSEAQVGRHSRDETVEAYVVKNDLYAPGARIHISFSQKDGKLANDMAELIEQQMRVLLREKADLTVTRSDGTPTGEIQRENPRSLGGGSEYCSRPPQSGLPQ